MRARASPAPRMIMDSAKSASCWVSTEARFQRRADRPPILHRPALGPPPGGPHENAGPRSPRSQGRRSGPRGRGDASGRGAVQSHRGRGGEAPRCGFLGAGGGSRPARPPIPCERGVRDHSYADRTVVIAVLAVWRRASTPVAKPQVEASLAQGHRASKVFRALDGRQRLVRDRVREEPPSCGARARSRLARAPIARCLAGARA